MSLRILQIATFIFAATIEIKVHAAEIVNLKLETAPLQDPKKCLEEVGERCAIGTSSGKKIAIEFSGAKVTLGSKTSVIRTAKDKVILVSGTLLVHAEAPIFIETEYGQIILKNADAILARDSKKISMNVMSGHAYIEPRGRAEMVQVEPGTTNWLSAVDKTGIAQFGIATPVAFQSHALLWSSLYDGHSYQFKKDLKEFAITWKSASEKASVAHKDLAQRRIASLEQDYQKRQARAKKQQAYESNLRSMFRKKSLDQ